MGSGQGSSECSPLKGPLSLHICSGSPVQRWGGGCLPRVLSGGDTGGIGFLICTKLARLGHSLRLWYSGVCPLTLPCSVCPSCSGLWRSRTQEFIHCFPRPWSLSTPLLSPSLGNQLLPLDPVVSQLLSGGHPCQAGQEECGLIWVGMCSLGLPMERGWGTETKPLQVQQTQEDSGRGDRPLGPSWAVPPPHRRLSSRCVLQQNGPPWRWEGSTFLGM